jgi:ankyrin repeat protein
VRAQPLSFNLSLDDPNYGDDDLGMQRREDSDDRFMQMLASQARLKDDDDAGGVEATLKDDSLSDSAKRDTLQSMFTMAASNGQLDRVQAFLDGPARDWIDLNAPDAEGTPPLIYASCFGHQDVVAALLDAGANVNKQDKNQWSSLMWAMTNRHKSIAKLLLDHGADPDVKSSSGRTAHDFLAPHSEMSDYLHDSGYSIGNAGVTDDFYNAGMAEDRFEEELAENEMRRRMMMESAINLEVDLGNLGLDEQPEVCISA